LARKSNFLASTNKTAPQPRCSKRRWSTGASVTRIPTDIDMPVPNREIMSERNRTAFLLLVGALVAKMDRKNRVFDEEMQVLLTEAIRQQLLPNDQMDQLLTMAIRKNHLSRDEVIQVIEVAIRELPERQRVAQAEVLRCLRQRIMRYRKSADRRS
jgi:hypothetical protein